MVTCGLTYVAEAEGRRDARLEVLARVEERLALRLVGRIVQLRPVWRSKTPASRNTVSDLVESVVFIDRKRGPGRKRAI